MRRMRRLGSTTALTLAGVAAAAAASAHAAAPTRISCGKLPAGAVQGRDVTCLAVQVPARHARPSGPRYRVTLSVVPARRKTSARPLVLLGGGPGQSFAQTGVDVAGRAGRTSFFGRLRETRDLIFIDQRGAGASSPRLVCTSEERALVKQPRLDDATSVAGQVAAYSACARRLKGAGIDLSTFTSSEIAADVRQVVADLRIAKADVLGVSYGTKVALLAAARDDSWIGRIVLSSTIAPGANVAQDQPRTFASALRRTFALCARTAACAKRYPDLAGRLDRGLASLEAKPLTTPAATKLGVALTAGTAAGILYQSYYSPIGFGLVPTLVAAFARRDPKLLSTSGGGDDADDDAAPLVLATGQFFAVECSEELASYDPARALADAAKLGAAARVFTQTNVQFGAPSKQICGAFGVPASRAKPADLSQIRRPVLVVNGQFDQVTPPAYGTAVARGLPFGRLLTLPLGHSAITAAGDCGVEVVQQFLNAQRRLASCAT